MVDFARKMSLSETLPPGPPNLFVSISLQPFLPGGGVARGPRHALLVGNATRNILGSPSELVKSKLEAVQSHWEAGTPRFGAVTHEFTSSVSGLYFWTLYFLGRPF